MVNVHLLFSVFLTTQRLTPKGYYREIFEQDKIDQLLTTLTSMSNLDFASADLRIELSDKYSVDRKAVKNFVDQEFNKASYKESRLEYFRDWQLALLQIPEKTDWVLLLNNHDHAFIGQDKKQWNDFLEFITPLSAIDLVQISHWTETLGWSKLRVTRLENGRKFLYFEDTTCIGAVLIRPKLLQSCFQRDFTKGARFIRPDNPFGPVMSFPRRPVLVPDTEFFRHLDGYGHMGLTSKFASYLRTNVSRSAGGGLTRKDWDYAQQPFDAKSADLLLLPIMYPVERQRDQYLLPNILYLATRYRFRPRVIRYFVQKFSVSQMVACSILRIILLPSTLVSVLNPLLQLFRNLVPSNTWDPN